MFLTNGIKVLRTTYINALAARYRCRGFATEKNSYVAVTIDPEFDGSVAVVTMQKKPVNALCSNLYRELIKTIDDLESNENMRGMIITSAFPGVFSAGLDFNALLDATLDDIHKLNKDFHDLTLKLYGSRLITIAALNGHSMAGGALMAVTADYRVMAEGSYRIGLNETQIGLFLPSYLKQMVENVIGSKATARALQLSLVFTSAEACKLGLVEEVTPMDQVMTAARREVKQWLEIPGSVAVVTMQKKPVNALCSNLYRELIKTIDDLENNEDMRGLILTSAFPGVFSAGLDFNAQLGATRGDIHKRNKDFLDFMLKLYGSRLITIAAVNVSKRSVSKNIFMKLTQGHSVGGGALLVVAADYRVMAEGSYRIGLNETQIGLFLPSYLTQMVENLIGSKATARALQLSLVFTSAEACKLGLVEEVTPMDQVLTAARREVKQWLEIPDSARASMKMELRRKVIQEMIDRREEDAKTFASTMASPEFQTRLRSIINNMKRK
ncbi:Enoyl-CoA delta isomerase 1, mitochondrial [Holothuria leucospilota]|uniref:Enoyl-CoA delta isomerase 1, mitochondrial n=1 Tax=Holothuria leucospilota TaxID=206669 RepID=A0A9Q1CII1_HOLLE|nr:Enoyl-CoA delta isomerase 1, mitochondrial [Holothuria leucospilota]